MKWWDRIVERFQRGIEEEDLELEWDGSSIESWDWETLLKDRDMLKMTDDYERQKFIRSCVDQLNTSSGQLEQLSEEYNMVTAYLKDMEEIEALPQSEMECVQENARKIVTYEGARKEYQEKKNRLTERQFSLMENYEDIMPKPYQDIREAEEYRELIKADMTRLEGEKHAYQYRKQELQKDIANARGMVFICLIASCLCLMMLAILQFGFEMNTQIGYILTLGGGAIALTVLYVKYLDFRTQLSRTEKGINKIILLKNTVNIRYVNNTNLLEYYYMKYKVNNGKELLTLWEKYQQEKEERIKDRKNRGELDRHKRELIKVLKRYQLHDPEVWLHQTEALLDKKEMVEIRHNLIERRQKLRVQMEYNKRLAEEAQQEIKKTIEDYPQYREEILSMVNRFQSRIA
ncbi:MAG: hypothetical protein MR383_01215 [Lachnospiraceae bacterium]|nr:hypothetical protein [Lachnospiraceae bacterium]MDD7026102.1 hypothetical protein [Lachnospiraceae bacterium]MDY5701828.1 hypothetical protein [Lachnospiraceae bacterium]